ncbi:hypothetical protein BD779DRAFT_776164 [Infundibulicybe gibba]|nr:hypothetical protein BD779DRAFT_776164 [Infundibulicybe gibba]
MDTEETAVDACSGSKFTHIPQQSRSEVVKEARALFKRIIHDTRANLEDPDTVASPQFRHVALTTRLLNSYLSIHYKHSTLDKSCKLFGMRNMMCRESSPMWRYWRGVATPVGDMNERQRYCLRNRCG